jgi:beta-glucosidase
MGDCSTINTLAPSDFALLTQAKGAAKKVIAVVVSGRPVLITDQLANADAWVAAWLPGTEGGGVADILFGDVKPTGKLSHSWPMLDVSTQGAQTNQDTGYKALFALNFGLTY